MRVKKILMVGAITLASALSVNAQSLSDILGGLGGNSGNSSSGLGNIIGNVVSGVFTQTNLTVADIVGEYTSEGPAVTFKSDNFLQKAGGIAAASALESKLQPYYQQYGLTGMVLTIDENANFTMKVKSINLKGTVAQGTTEGTFTFNFQVVGINLGKFTAYVEKSGNNLNLMFDASKLLDFISAVTKITGNSMASTVGSLLGSYDGMCIGFKMVGAASNNSNNAGSAVSSGLNSLMNILGGSK
ncbi:MAG: DUF4923 family protein [Muribaculaceae bacterium]|nr:DUF4923 family protein [Muribaculaceae bacterium]